LKKNTGIARSTIREWVINMTHLSGFCGSRRRLFGAGRKLSFQSDEALKNWVIDERTKKNGVT
jgi:hypothetical protein